MRGRLLVCLLFLAAGCVGPGPLAGETPAESSATRMIVTDVVDGDTVRARTAAGESVTLRLIGVDAPETRGDTAPGEFEGVPDTEGGAACLRTVATEATAVVERAVSGGEVEVRFDERAGRRDIYGRLLVYVDVNGTDLNRRLVVEGYARVYTAETFAREEEYLDAERAAQREGSGVWRCRSPETATAVPAQSATGLAVAEVHADAAGDDRQNLNDEYVVFENAGTKPVDLSGWRVSDEAGWSYTVPDGVALGPGECLTLYTGDGQNTGSELHRGAGGPVWNNGGDTVTVQTASGVTALRHSYP